MQPGVAALLIALIEFLGERLLECETPDAIRLDEKSIAILIMIAASLDHSVLRENCPSFCEVFLAVMLREIEDSQINGKVEQARDPERG